MVVVPFSRKELLFRHDVAKHETREGGEGESLKVDEGQENKRQSRKHSVVDIFSEALTKLSASLSGRLPGGMLLRKAQIYDLVQLKHWAW